MTTRAPSSANSSAVPKPMPEQPPLIQATLPSNRPLNRNSPPIRSRDINISISQGIASSTFAKDRPLKHQRNRRLWPLNHRPPNIIGQSPVTPPRSVRMRQHRQHHSATPGPHPCTPPQGPTVLPPRPKLLHATGRRREPSPSRRPLSKGQARRTDQPG